MEEEAFPIPNDTLPKTAHEDPALTEMIKEEISNFKNILAKEEFFPSVNPSGQQGLSWEERGKVLGSLLGHYMQNKKMHIYFLIQKRVITSRFILDI